jgi:MFS family permease
LSARIRGLWRHPDFLKLWGGQTVSVFGSQISQLAVPTVAILVLKATPFQVGLLGALQFLAFPVLGLVAGVWVDRLYRRPVLILCDVARALALASIPIAFVMGGLTMEVLYVVALVSGVATVFFDVAYQSYLPALIDRQALVEGNTKLEISRSSAQIAGPPLTGILIQILQPAWAVLLDAISFVVSAVSIGAIGKPEPVPQPGTLGGKRGFWAELGEGLRVVLGSPILRMISASTATSNLGSNIGGAVQLIFVYRQRTFPRPWREPCSVWRAWDGSWGRWWQPAPRAGSNWDRRSSWRWPAAASSVSGSRWPRSYRLSWRPACSWPPGSPKPR